MAFLRLAKLGLFLMLLGIIFQRRVVDTVKDLPPSDSRLNRGQTRFSSPCLLDLSLISAFRINSVQCVCNRFVTIH